MNIIETKFQGVWIIEPQVSQDSRGFFMESYSEQKWRDQGLHYHFVQDNHAYSAQAGVLRGLHYQLPPRAQAKLVRATRGAIYDVVVDIRRTSPTFGQWVGVILTEQNKRQLLVSRGFAHGYCTLVDHTEVQYKVDDDYSPEHDRGVLWNDPALQIEWPVSEPILSDKDRAQPVLAQATVFDDFV